VKWKPAAGALMFVPVLRRRRFRRGTIDAVQRTKWGNLMPASASLVGTVWVQLFRRRQQDNHRRGVLSHRSIGEEIPVWYLLGGVDC
jgi:hypothetical protein